MKICAECNGSGKVLIDPHNRFESTCYSCKGIGGFANHPPVFFTLYENERYQNNTLEEAMMRAISKANCRFIRIEFGPDEGDGVPTIKSAQYVTEESLQEESSKRELLKSMRSDLIDGDIEG